MLIRCLNANVLNDTSLTTFVLQLVFVAVITMTVFLRTRMAVDLEHSNYYLGSLFYTLIRLMTNGVAELFLTISTLPVFYKQKEGYLYPVWAYSIPTSILKTPYALVESILWTAITYYTIGYSPEAKRLGFFKLQNLIAKNFGYMIMFSPFTTSQYLYFFNGC